MKLPLKISVRKSDSIESSIPGYIAGMNASFGFNTTPHSFDIESVREEFGGDLTLLPENGDEVEITIGGSPFKVKGVVTHKDYSESISGTTHSLKVEDKRTLLDSCVFFTEDIGEELAPTLNIISVGRNFRLNTDPLDYLEYDRINNMGATYAEILEAIQNCGITIGGVDIEDIMPSMETIQNNMSIAADIDDGALVTITNYRWQFNGQKLKDAITGILDDLGFDWYWDMGADKVKIIKRSNVYIISRDNIPIPGDTAEIKSIKYGKDDTKSNINFLLLGARQEGFIDGGLLSEIDGIETPSNITWLPAWKSITVSFSDEGGNVNSYVPAEKELQIALTNIEAWSYYKKHQSQWGAIDVGASVAGTDSFESRLDILLQPNNSPLFSASGIRYINNRRDLEQNWILTWYDRVRTVASNYYGRAYYASGILLDRDMGKFSLTDSAWCNLENQKEDASLAFIEGYRIDQDYDYLSPFVTKEFKVSAHVKLPGTTLYGVDGNAAPSEFDNWNELPDGSSHYIPTSLQEVTLEPIDPRNFLSPFDTFPLGTVLCTLPTIACSGFDRDAILAQLETIQFNEDNSVKTLIDVLSTAKLPTPYQNLNGRVAVPVVSNIRYGGGYPSVWNKDNSINEVARTEVLVDERFAPWNFTVGRPNWSGLWNLNQLLGHSRPRLCRHKGRLFRGSYFRRGREGWFPYNLLR